MKRASRKKLLVPESKPGRSKKPIALQRIDRTQKELLEHRSSVLQSWRQITHRISTQKDAHGLIEVICTELLQSRGYHSVWIALFDKQKQITFFASAGLGKKQKEFEQALKKQTIPRCADLALQTDNVVLIDNPQNECPDCPLSLEAGDSALTARLRSADCDYGVMSLYMPKHIAHYPEETSLFQGIACEVAMALHGIAREKELQRIQWLFTQSLEPARSDRHIQAYGDLTELNDNGLILKSVGMEMLTQIVQDYLDLLDTSAAVYERNGDYALGIFSSGWCRLLDEAARKCCKTNDNQVALECGKWHCHESCWHDASKASMEIKAPVDVECRGGIHLYAVPIFAGREVVGSMNFGYGDPPQDMDKLRELAELYQTPLEDLVKAAQAYQSRPTYMIELAKARLHTSATLIGTIVEEKLSEQALLNREEEFRQFANATWEAIVIHEEGKILHANDQYYRMFGYTAEDLEGKQALPLTVAPESLDEIKSRIATGDMGPYEVTGLKKDGTRFPLEIRVRKIHYRGRMARVAAIRDISEQKCTEQELRNREDTLNSIFRAAPVGIGMVVNRVIQRANDRLLEMTGYGRDELLNQNARMLYPTQADYEFVGQEKYRQISEHGTGTVETRWRRKDGTLIDVLLSSTPLDTGDLNAGVTFTALDITERKQAEHALRESEERFRNTVKSSPMGIILYQLEHDDRLVFVDSNEAADHFIGIHCQDLIGKTIEEAFPPLQFTEIPGRYREAAAKGISWSTQDFDYADGEITGCYDVFAFQTSPNCMAVMFNEVTQRKRAEIERERLLKSLEAKNRELESLVYISSHDLRSPLVNIQGFAVEMRSACERLSRMLAETANHEEMAHVLQEDLMLCLGYIDDSANKMDGLLKGLLQLSRLGQKQVKTGIIETERMVNTILRTMQYQIQEARVKITHDPLPPCMGDEQEINQVFSNLIDNAVKFLDPSRKAKTIHISAETRNNTITYGFRDNGLGIAADHIPKIFEVFHRLNPRDGLPGQGLGLTIVQRMLDRNGGSISVTSEPGKGTTFYVTLPAT